MGRRVSVAVFGFGSGRLTRRSVWVKSYFEDLFNSVTCCLLSSIVAFIRGGAGVTAGAAAAGCLFGSRSASSTDPNNGRADRGGGLTDPNNIRFVSGEDPSVGWPAAILTAVGTVVAFQELWCIIGGQKS